MSFVTTQPESLGEAAGTLQGIGSAMMAGSAFAAGAVQLTVALRSPRTAVTPVGFPGTVPTRTGADASDGGPSPAALVAMTTNV